MTHYLKQELDSLLRDDPKIFDFIEAASLDGLWYWDLTQPEHEWMSRKFWLTLGYDPDEMPHEASAWMDIINPEDLEIAKRNVAAHCADPSQPYDQVVRYRHAQGHVVTVRCRGIAIRDEQGTPIRMLGAHNDLTREQRVKQLLTETNRDARVGSWEYIVATGEIYWSDITREIHEMPSDYSPNLENGISFYKEGHSRDTIKILLDRAFEHGEPWNVELQIITGKGNERWVRAVGRAVRVAGKTVRLYGSFQDIHQDKLISLALQRSESLLRMTNEAARIGWWEYIPATQAVNYSPVVNEIHGLSPEQQWTTERALSYYEPGPERDSLVAAFERCLTTGQTYERDFKIRTEQGAVRWIRAVGRAELIDGKVDRVVGSFQDIHNQKLRDNQLLERELLLSQNFELAPNAMVITDSDGRFIRFNKSFKEMFGYSDDEIDTMEFSDVIHPDDVKNYLKLTTAFLEGTVNTSRAERRLSTKEGNTVWADASISVTRDVEGEVGRFHVQLVDVTEKKLSDARRQRIAFLEDKAKEMEQFAYIASHDLRQPVLTIQGYMEALVEDFGDSLPVEGQRYIEVVQGALARMDDMIKGLLDYSRLSKAKQLQLVNVESLVEDVLKDLSGLIKQTGATVTTDEFSPVPGYPLELRQVFQNLIANALKYHRPGVAPRVYISAKKVEGGYEYCVSDNGLGIPVSDQQRIFGLFQTVGTALHNKGTGIGLASCRTIVERHGGTIWVVSSEGKGSTFCFTVLTAYSVDE